MTKDFKKEIVLKNVRELLRGISVSDIYSDIILEQFSLHEETIKKELREISKYTQHLTPDCILSRFNAGRPTKNGGYEQQYGSKWYEVKPIDKTPKCNCGLDSVLQLLDNKK